MTALRLPGASGNVWNVVTKSNVAAFLATELPLDVLGRQLTAAAAADKDVRTDVLNVTKNVFPLWKTYHS